MNASSDYYLVSIRGVDLSYVLIDKNTMTEPEI